MQHTAQRCFLAGIIFSIMGKCQWFQTLLSLLQVSVRQAVLLHYHRKHDPQSMLFALKETCVVQVLGKGLG